MDNKVTIYNLDEFFTDVTTGSTDDRHLENFYDLFTFYKCLVHSRLIFYKADLIVANSDECEQDLLEEIRHHLTDYYEYFLDGLLLDNINVLIDNWYNLPQAVPVSNFELST